MNRKFKCLLLCQELVLIFVSIFVELEDILACWHHTLSATVVSSPSKNCLVEIYILVVGIIRMLPRVRITAWEAEVGEWCVQNAENRLKPPLLFLVSECCWHLLMHVKVTFASFTFYSFHKICSM